MGWKRKRGKTTGPKRSRDDGSEPPRKKKTGNWSKTPRENDKLEAYYKRMGVVPEAEWTAFITSLKDDLPTTFRVSPIGVFAELAQKQLREFAQEMDTKEEIEGQVLEPPTPISWYPDQGAWYIKAGRGPIRSHPKYKKFHKFLTAFTEFGGISRQEAVSMIPPLLLDVKAHHVVLDMCAAPGSKTAQMVEFMHLDAAENTMPSGVIIANDVDEKRCYMMIHQVNRLSSPCVIATQHLAQKFPFVRMNANRPDETHPDLVFDRILADVPCSGDGTFRKNFDLWSKWNAGMGLGLHKIQVQIATRGVKLLKIGGRMVYSTCSLNPVEDEAVVAEILRRGKGVLKLVDVSRELPTLKRLDGVSKWPVYVHGEYYDAFADVPAHQQGHTQESLYPPTAEEAAEFHLERCMRILPHHQDTGGFFVAVIEKTDSIPLHLGLSKKDLYRAAAEKRHLEAVAAAEAAGEPIPQLPVREPKKKEADGDGEAGGRYSREDPFMFLEGPRWEAAVANLKEFYGFNDAFPVPFLLCRSEGTCPRIYLTSEKAQIVLRFEENKCLRIVNMGLRLFGKHSFKDAICPYRINSEGLGPIVPFMSTKRRVNLSMAELKILLTKEHPHFYLFSDETEAQFQPLEIGGVWFSVDVSEYGLTTPMLLSGWRGKVSSHLLSNTTESRLLKGLFLTEEERNPPVVEEVVEDAEVKEPVEATDAQEPAQEAATQ